MKEATSGFTKQLAERFASDVYNVLKEIGRTAGVITQSALEMGFSEYVKVTIDRCRYMKTIINRYEKVDIYDIYEDLSLINSKKKYREDDILLDIDRSRVVITGTAGSGKSSMMRRAVLRMVEVNQGYFPIFVELRHLNSVQKPDILKYACSFMEPHVKNVSSNLLDRLFKTGKIVLILDGFDELYDSVKSDVSIQIQDLSYRYPSCRIIVSGRPDDTFTTWYSFDEFKVEELNKKQCLSLIGKAIFPKEERDRFQKNVDEKLYDTHSEYLSNPLLTYVMLMTADQFSEFPDEMSSFYEKAFETLYSGHDLIKSGEFRRQVRCNLKLKEIERILEYFCAVSYLDGHYQYSNSSIRSYMETALGLSKVEFSIDDIIYDLTRSYCLLLIDGTNYSYIHRTFQEYFSAKCVTKSERIDYTIYNTKIVASRRENSSYIKLIMEIGYEKFEERYIIPTMERYVSECKRLLRSDPRGFLQLHLSAIGVSPDGYVQVLVWNGTSKEFWWGFAVSFLAVYKPKVFPDKFFYLKEPVENIRKNKKIKLIENEDDIPEYYNCELSLLPQSLVRSLVFYQRMAERVNAVAEELARLRSGVNSEKKLVAVRRRPAQPE